MFGFLIRLIACLILAVGTVFAIGDIARSLSVHGLRLTSVSEAAGFLPGGLAAGAEPSALQTLLSLIADWPVSPTLAALAFLLLLAGRRRPEPAGLR